jgi:uncharacterized protein (TIGR02302 family)
MTGKTPEPPLQSLVWPMRLTLAGLWAERLARAFWPLWSLVLITLAALAFGLQDLGPLRYAQAAGAVLGLAALALLALGLKRFRKPTAMDALDRLDATMPGRPIAALRDTQAIGLGDPASLAVWRAHRERMAERAAGARPVQPDLRLSSRDRFSLRYVALTAFVMAALFGSFWKAGTVAGLTPGAAVAMPGGPSWEAWAQPPAYTGKPSLYLNDITDPKLDLPTGTRLQIRLYGPEGDLSVTQTIADVPKPEPAPAPDAKATPAAVPNAMKGVYDLTVTRSGDLAIDGPGGREWQITALPDAAPTVEVSGDMTREADGRFKQSIKASDDYGVTAAHVTIALDMARVDRRHGLKVDPEAVEPVVLDIPLPRKGKRTELTATLVDDLSKHVFANLPVTMTFTVADAGGNEGSSAPYNVTLHGKRFFDPLAAALIEMRRDILWNRVNAPRAVELLKAVTNRPEGFIRHDRAFLHLRVLMRSLEAQEAALTTESRDKIAEELWKIALMVEEGNLQDAFDRLQRAQDRLDEAIKNGASPEEIDQLMKEMQQALNDYMRELAEESQRNPDQQQSQMMQGQMMSGDQLKEMLDKLQQLMEEGKTAEAAELMEQLRQLMQNMQVVQGQQGQGQGGPGQKGMQGLGDTLRDQQDLSDDAFRDLQGVPRPGQEQGQDQGQGQEQGQDQGQGNQQGDQFGQDQTDQGQGDGDQGSLSDRQRGLRERLNQLQSGDLPGDGSEKGEAGRRDLDRAGRAMEEAENALRDGDLSGALDRQAEAMEALRDGMQNLGEALADEQRQNRDGQGGERDYGSADPNGTDPLGRRPGETARIGSDQNMVQNDPDTRAQELLDEIRRRSGELTRPLEELDYLKRLLQMF